MAYERIDGPKGLLYHYTKRENIEPILQDGRIRKFKDRECWFCTSLEDTLRLMELTVMEEGKLYYDANGLQGDIQSLYRKNMWCWSYPQDTRMGIG